MKKRKNAKRNVILLIMILVVQSIMPITAYADTATIDEVFIDDENQPSGDRVIVELGGTILVSDNYGHQIYRYDQDGKFKESLNAEDLWYPSAVDVGDVSGNVYVADGYNYIRVYSADTNELINTIGTKPENDEDPGDFGSISALCVDEATGKIYSVGYNSGLWEIDIDSKTGEQLATPEELGLPSCEDIQEDTDGNLYISGSVFGGESGGSTGKIVKVTLEPLMQIQTVYEANYELKRMEISPSGLIYFVDGNQLVKRLNANGTIDVVAYGSMLRLPADIAFDQDGDLLIANYYGNEIDSVVTKAPDRTVGPTAVISEAGTIEVSDVQSGDIIKVYTLEEGEEGTAFTEEASVTADGDTASIENTFETGNIYISYTRNGTGSGLRELAVQAQSEDPGDDPGEEPEESGDELPTEFMDVLTANAEGISDFEMNSIAGQIDTPDGSQIGIIEQTNFGTLSGSALTLPSSSVMLSTGTLAGNKSWVTPGDEDVYNQLNSEAAAELGFSSDETNDAASLEFSFTADEGIESVTFSLIYATSEEIGDMEYLDAAVVMVDGENYAVFPNGYLLSNANGDFLCETDGDIITGFYNISPVQKVTALLDPEVSIHTMKVAIADNNDCSVPSAILITGLTGSESTEGGIVQENQDEPQEEPVAPAEPVTPINSGGGGGASNNTNTSATVVVNGQSQSAGTQSQAIINGIKNITVEVNKNTISNTIDSILSNSGTTDAKDNVIEVPVASKEGDTVKVGLTGDLVKKMEDGSFALKVISNNVSYIVPSGDIRISEAAQELGAGDNLGNVEVRVNIIQPTAETVAKLKEQAEVKDYEIVIPPVSFEITAVNTRTNQAMTIDSFNNYVERMFEIPTDVDPSKITTGIVYNNDGTFSHIPTMIIQADGKYYAKLNSLTNSTYSVVWNPVTVASVENHWAREAVNDMAARLVIKNPETFDPNQKITRGEFSEYITKALGLYRTGIAGDGIFTDVNKTDELADAIKTAVDYGIIKGYTDGSFKPDAKISRQEAMVMYSRAMGITKLVGVDQSRINKYTDYSSVSNWAKENVKQVIDAKVFNGVSATTLAPNSTLTTAEAATAVRNLLVQSQLINQ